MLRGECCGHSSWLSSNAQAWLRGDASCGFFKWKPQGELAVLWAEYGDHENMFWENRYCLPARRDNGRSATE